MLTPRFRSDCLRSVRFYAPFVFVALAPAAMISLGHSAVAQEATPPAPVMKAAEFTQVSPKTFVMPERLKSTTYNVNVGVRVTMFGSGLLNVEVTKSSGYPALDEAVKYASLKIKFTPAVQDGEPVDFVQRFNFHLTNRG